MHALRLLTSDSLCCLIKSLTSCGQESDDVRSLTAMRFVTITLANIGEDLKHHKKRVETA
jgi:hypothetical protein